MDKDIEAFQRIIVDYIQRHNLNNHSFSQRADIAHTTLNRLLHPTKPSIPDIETVLKLANAMSLEPHTLISTLYPQVRRSAAPRSFISDYFSRLPPDQQEVLTELARVLLDKNTNSE